MKKNSETVGRHQNKKKHLLMYTIKFSELANYQLEEI